MKKKSTFGKEIKRVEGIVLTTEIQRQKKMTPQEKLEQEKKRKIWEAEEEKELAKYEVSERAAYEAAYALEEAAYALEEEKARTRIKRITKQYWRNRYGADEDAGKEVVGERMPTLAEIEKACGSDFLETFVLFMSGFDQAVQDQNSKQECWEVFHELLEGLEEAMCHAIMEQD